MLPRYLSDCLVELDHPKDVYLELCERRPDVYPDDWEKFDLEGFRLVGLLSYESMEFDGDYAIVIDVGSVTMFCEIDDRPTPHIYGPDGEGFMMTGDGASLYRACGYAKDVADTIDDWIPKDD